MKTVCILLLFALLSATHTDAQRQRSLDSVNVTIRLKKHFTKNAPVDSVLVFFDRFDHSGAGIIKQVFYPSNNHILIPQVPAGRYYIGIICLGAHMQYFSEVTFVNKRRSNKLKFTLDRSEQFIAGTYIPDTYADLARLYITNARSFK
jgi:hypothetical protein